MICSQNTWVFIKCQLYPILKCEEYIENDRLFIGGDLKKILKNINQ